MSEAKPSRAVRINTARNCHFVEYVTRKPRTPRLAAQFDARTASLEFVKTWVRKQPGIHLEA